MMSDKAHFHLNGVANKQNYRYWTMKYLRNYIYEQPLHSPRVTIFSSISKRGIIGPSLFEKNRITV